MPFLRAALAQEPDAPAVLFGDGAWSYWELARKAEDAARRLRTLEVGRGDVVALRAEPDPEGIALLHGVWMAGGAVAPLDPRWTKGETKRALEEVSPRLELLGPETLAGTPPSGDPLPGLQESAVAAHLLTSGTTGRPRVVHLTTGNLLANARGTRERLSLKASDRWLGSLSLAHVGGLALVTRASLLGSGLVLRGSFRPETFAYLAASGAITHASLVPTMLHQLLEEWGSRPAPGTLQCLLIGGARAPEPLLERALERGFPLALTYGLTEATSQVATAPPSLTRRKPGTVGPPLPGVEVGVDDSGEVLVRGPTVARGVAGEDGWLRTRDLGRLDEEGHLWITGRISDRIITGGVNVDPAEVESVLLTHPEVVDAAVVGIPDPEWGERVVAVLVAGRHDPSLEQEVDRLVRSALSSPKRPRSYRVALVLPRNRNGKVDRESLRALFR